MGLPNIKFQWKDISDFDNTKDYLPILNGTLNGVLLLMFLVMHKFIYSLYLKIWFKKFHLSAILENVTTYFLIIIASRFIYHYVFPYWNIILFGLLTSLIMFIYDIFFTLTFTYLPKGYSRIIDFFKKYRNNISRSSGFIINIWMISLICLLSSYFATLDTNLNIITLISTCFFIPYLLYME